MDIMSMLKSSTGLINMAWSAFLGDYIHDLVEKKRDGGSSGDTPVSKTENRSEKVKPFLGIAVLSREDNYKFTRTMDKLTGDEQGHLTEFLLEYYIRPAQNQGLITKIASFWQYDQFMLETVNRDSSSKSLGSKKITTVVVDDTPRVDRTANRSAYAGNGKQKVANVDRTSTTGGTKTTTTTEETKEFFTPGGTESVTFLQNLATYYRDGGMKAAEDYLRINKMPMMDSENLKKVEDFIGGKYETAMGWLEVAFGYTKETILTKLPEKVKAAHATFIEHTDNYAERKAARRGFVGRLSRIINF